MPANNFFKSLILFFSLITVNHSYSQFDGRFGVGISGNNYVTDANFLLSKSKLGFGVSLIGTTVFSDHFELFVEMNYSRNNMSFIGRESELSNPEELNFHLDKFNIPIILNYTYLNTKDLALGIEMGPTISILNNFVLNDDEKSNYLLDPYYIRTEWMEFDSQNEKISLNVFGTVGLSAEYNQFLVNLRYNLSITDPYRKVPFYSPYFTPSGKDSYFALSLTYMFEEK